MGTEGIEMTQQAESSFPLEKNFPLSPENYRRHYPTQNPGLAGTNLERSDPYLPTRQVAPLSFELGQTKVLGVYNETIREWWYGKILRIDFEERFFEADLQDIAGLQMLAEFDFSVAFEGASDDEISTNLYIGSDFVYYVTREHGGGSPSTRSSIEFIEPHIWTTENQEKAQEKYDELLHNDPFDNR